MACCIQKILEQSYYPQMKNIVVYFTKSGRITTGLLQSTKTTHPASYKTTLNNI